MDYKQVEKRMNDEIDRLSNLPDDLIHKILSFVGIKCAIELSGLSSRWRYIWTSMPHLNFFFTDFDMFAELSHFVTHLLSRRNNLVEVFSITLCFDGDFDQDFVEQLLNYAFSHNIRQLDITWFYENSVEIPLSLICSQSLTHLSMRGDYIRQTVRRYGCTSTSTLELPALTTLYLHACTLCCDENINKHIFSKCANLKILTLKGCKVIGSDHLNICHPLLSNLTLEDVHGSLNVVNVVAPQLKSLTINDCFKKYQFLISAPNLVSLLYKGYHSLDLSTDGFHLLEKVDLCVSGGIASPHKIVCLFQHLQSIKYLTLNLEILELLSSSVQLILNRPSPFANLKSLHIYPVKELSEVRNFVEMSSEVKNYLLENSPSATFTMVSREEMRVRKDTKLAQNQMARLRVMLEHEKTKMETNIAQVENLLQMGRRMTHVNRCWEGLSDRIEQGKEQTDDIISQLINIKGVLTKMPASKRAEMQPCFSSLCSEADTVVNKIMDHVKILCDMKRNHFTVYLQKLSAISEPSV
ncbi:F-box domain, Leucine-rich repeat domain, L domain-like protein [Artemisia annua]|uniref:F-box domain, Leucine-rich repeat domain, L domain-like protein n=1 Tax=Artemisia annua TaxID=35608 RepID=A0A2U1N2U8_ARTAN|nr:F-box domain, Leucine-rich repeat domain, L domain-like protein [Artemisia annua]